MSQKIRSVEHQLMVEKNASTDLKNKIKLEQDMKCKYKKRVATLSEENRNYLHILNAEKEEEKITLLQKERKKHNVC